MQMCMLNSNRIKTLSLLFFMVLLFSCNKKEKKLSIVHTDDYEDVISENQMIDDFFSKYDVSILENAIGKRIKDDLDVTQYISYGGYPMSLIDFLSKDLAYYVGFINKKDNFEKGCIVVFIKTCKVDNVPNESQEYLVDAKFIPSKDGYRVYNGPINYNLHIDGTCEEDETKYGIMLMPIEGWLPYNKKNIPLYIMSVTEGKLIFEVPENDEYFLYFSSNYDGI